MRKRVWPWPADSRHNVIYLSCSWLHLFTLPPWDQSLPRRKCTWSSHPVELPKSEYTEWGSKARYWNLDAGLGALAFLFATFQ